MSARYVALIIAAVALSACETTSVTEEGPAPKKRLVVRGEVVPDEPLLSAKSKNAGVKKATAVRTARAAPAVPAGEMAPVIDATPGASGSGGTGAGTGSNAGTGTSTGADTSTLANTSADAPGSGVTSSVLAPIDAPPTLSAEPAGPAPTPSPFAIDFREMLNATVAGFPLWLMVVVGIVLAGALVFGTGGRRGKPERDYEERPYPEREQRYDEASSYDDEPRGAAPQPA